MFPLCFVHGVHGIQSDHQPSDHPTDTTVGRAAPRRRLILACLTIVFIAAVALTGCTGPDRQRTAALSGTSAFYMDDVSGPDFDALLDEEFP